MYARVALALALASAGAGCFASVPPPGLPPEPPPKAAPAGPPKPPPPVALPSIEACKTPGRHDLLAVDWTPALRADLDAAMARGVALVSYDCRSLRVVPACSLDGAYGYLGTTRREKQLELSSAEEIAASLPVAGLAWLRELGGKLDPEGALIAQLVTVGKRATGRKQAARAELQGSCDDATHFVRAVTIGAFVVASGPKGARKTRAEAGDLAVCVAASPEDKDPPAQCDAVVRLELEPIGGAPAAAPELAVPTCAPGFAAADGACVPQGRPHQCDPGEAEECVAQCAAGAATSCVTLAALHRDGLAVPKDRPQAAALAGRACGVGVTAGCRMLAAAKLAGDGTAKDPKAALTLLEQACRAGDGPSCVDLGAARLADRKLAPDAPLAFRRACYGGGEAEGCAWLGVLQAQGKGGLAASPKLAVPLFEKGCKEGSMRACGGLGGLLKVGKGIKRDRARAKALLEQACSGGYAPACSKKKPARKK